MSVRGAAVFLRVGYVAGHCMAYIRLQTDQAMSQLGQTRNSGRATGKSASSSRTEVVSETRQVRKVPLATISAAQTAAYSITSLAKASNVGGIVSPSAFAVFMLITSSNLVACSTGKSAGLAPFSILSM